jgi:predicted dehydrogenase
MKSSENGMRLNVGILGCSDIAVRKFIPALLKSKNAVLAAVSGRSRLKSAKLVPEADYAAMDHEQLIAAQQIDIVYISLPNHLHEEWTIRALESGKHVICEKPLGLTYDSVVWMTDCAEKHGLLLFENLMFLYHPQHAAVKYILENGNIGRLLELKAVFGIPELQAGNFRLDPDAGGGAFHDMARYPIATALYFLGGGNYSFKGFAFDKGRLNVSVCCSALTSNNELFTCSMRFGQEYECYYELIGSGGKIRLDRAFTTPPEMENVLMVTKDNVGSAQTIPSADHFLLALDHACSLILNGGAYGPVHARSLKIAHLAEKMMEGCSHVEIS